MQPYFQTADGRVTLLHGHVLDVLSRHVGTESVHMCVTSPPYWGLRSYGTEPVVWGGSPDCDHRLPVSDRQGETYVGKRRWQRGRRGWADEDTWGFDTYLATVISQGVGYLRKNQQGFQCVHDKGEHKCMPEDWDVVLKDIEEGFRDYVRAQHGINFSGEQTAFQRAMEPFAKHFRGLWD